VIGTANLTEIARGPSQRCQLGFGLDASFTGQGLMGEALEALLNFAFGDLRLMKVNAGHLPDNTRSAALLQRLGFVREGVARNEVCINGQWRDHVLTARLNPHPERVQTDTTVNR
jgi:ribosomal-protein-alanine N-acetyltransferase